MGRPPCCSDKMHNRRCNWTEEVANTSKFVSKHGIANWTAMSKKSGTGKCGRSQKHRWSNRLKTDIKEDSFTLQQEELIIKLHATIGSRWSIIAQQIPGRTDNEVKNLWNTKLKKKLSAMGIDPVTHKPFSQILTDYGNIGGFPKARTRFVSLNRELKGAFVSTPEQLQHPLEIFPNFNSHCVTTIRLQKTETSEDCFLSNNQPPVDLLSELQAIRFVTEASDNNSPKAIFSYTNPIDTDCSLSSPLSSSSSSSASHSLTKNQVNRCDYLLDDAFQEDTLNIEEKLVAGAAQEYRQNNAPATKDFEATLSIKGTSPSSSSFVEDMLECENEMFLNFPGLSEDPFY
ncbi:PREDICTED: transcription factor MYB35-like [Nicotiana attenuata]|uniref:Transcription factor myb35 n=1 Tax=Nicotiana attenuata TaxID=49451 RepID=A0A1J6JXE9_NICAT|nr:PREDICTED: transcription factor MYB35-like [Nicotiana attenuata]OIT22450.1 transcription factor myb35 [Nicotiana attenuata]